MWFFGSNTTSFLRRNTAETPQLIIPDQAIQTTEVPADSGKHRTASKINERLRQENSFVTISANGMQPQTCSSSIYQTEGGTSTSPSPRTHDTSRAIYHVDHVDRFAAELDQAVSRAFPNKNLVRNRYLDIHVVLIRWEDDARLGVSCELDDLSRTFEKDYGFETTTWLIPTENPLTDITGKALELVKEAGKEGKLLILYYGGHARMNSDRQQIWLRTGRPNEGKLEWFALQQYFLNVKADVLFLLDCCSAASAATSSQTAVGTKETLAACGFESEAPEPGPHSFTSELIDVLRKWKHRTPFSVAMLHSELLANLRHPKSKEDMFHRIVESRRTPVYVVTTSNSRALSIELVCRQGEVVYGPDPLSQKRRRPSADSDTSVVALVDDSGSSPGASCTAPSSNIDSIVSGASTIDKYAENQLNRVLPGGDLSVPHVLISLALEGEQYLEVGAWEKWLKESPNFAKYVRVEGKFKSNSTLLLLSIPVIIWDLLPDNLACSFVAHVKSINHIRDGLWQDNDELQSWLKRERGMDNDLRDEKRNDSIRSLHENINDSGCDRRLENRPYPLFENHIYPQHTPHLPPESAHETISRTPGPSNLQEDVARDSVANDTSEDAGESPSVMCLQDSSSICSDVQPAGLLGHYDLISPVDEQLSPSCTNSVGSSGAEDECLIRSQSDASLQTPRSDNKRVYHVNYLLQKIWIENEKIELEESEHPSRGSRTDDPIVEPVPEGYSSHPYRYEPLTSSDEIRLVVLSPGHLSEPVRFSIKRVKLRDAPRYEALSYCWGDPMPRRSVFVDNCSLTISTTLFAALQSLRQDSSPRTIWIDALCINQADILERGRQVQIMSSIFSNALNVNIWLGPETDDSRIAIEKLNQHRFAILDGLGRHPNHKIKQMFNDTWATVEVGLLAREYWRRTWIIQEITLAPTITIVCGASIIDWNLLVAAMKLKHTEMLQFEMTRLAMNRPLVNFLEIERTRFQKYSASNSIESLVIRWRNSWATDPRDKIFALLGLAADVEDGDIVPDYHKTVDQVYCDFARFVITTRQKLDIISEGFGQSHSNYRSLPSWVPDWTLKSPEPLNRFLIQTDNESSKIVYRASKGSSMSATFSDDLRALFVKGFILDKIKTVGRALLPRRKFSDILTTARRMRRPSSDLFTVGMEDWRMDVSRTMSLDLFRRLFDDKDRHTLWDMFKSTYRPPATYRPGAPLDQRLEMFRIDVLYTMLRLNLGRRFVMTHNGYMALVPAGAHVGDAICILFGGSVPFVLRREQVHYKLIGSCYVHGVMDGEAMDEFEAGLFKIETFAIH